MRLTQVAPSPADDPAGPVRDRKSPPVPNDLEPIVYEFAQTTRLHAVDVSRSVKSELLSATAITRWNAIVRRLRLFLSVSYPLALFITPVAVVVPTHSGRWVALANLPLALPGSIAMILSLRYDMLYVLLGTYEFWFYSIVALVTCGSFALYLGDARAVTTVFIALGVLTCLLVDASITLSRTFVVTSVIGTALSLTVVTTVQLQLIPDVSTLTMTYNGRTIGLPDAIANGIVTLIIVLARNGYRRREAVLHNAANPTSIRCISYCCNLKLHCVSTPAHMNPTQRPQRQLRHSTIPHLLSTMASMASRRTREPQSSRTSSVPHALSGQLSEASFNASEMKLVPIQEQFDGRLTLFGYQQSSEPWSWIARWALVLLAMSGAPFAGVLFFVEFVFGQDTPRGLCIASFVASCVITQIVVPLMQPKMLRRLWSSFDFVFLSFQLTILHVCICDTLRWDHRALLCLSGFIWIHLILMLDALMPITRQRIGIHKAFAMLVAFGFAACNVGYLVKLVVADEWEVYDRVLFDVICFGRHLRMHVVPLICSRQPMVITWSLRLLWRIYKSQEGELILIRGAVAYDSQLLQQGRR